MDGIIIINKPKEFTSNDVVNKVKRILNTKVGHTGTLDPNATGVLPLLLGNGTKFSKYLINHDKKYIATIKLGEKTTTADIEGEVIELKEVDKNLKEDEIKKVLDTFVGKQKQIPPIYSAIKVKGKKLYEYARSGKEVDIPVREIEIYDIQLICFYTESKELTFEVKCSKGTYIRSLCESISEKLGTVGYMKELSRTKVGEFDIKDAVTIDELEENKDNVDWLKRNIVSLEDVLKDCKEFSIESEEEFNRFLNGVKLKNSNNDGIYRIYYNKKFIGSGENLNSEMKRDVIL